MYEVEKKDVWTTIGKLVDLCIKNMDAKVEFDPDKVHDPIKIFMIKGAKPRSIIDDFKESPIILDERLKMYQEAKQNNDIFKKYDVTDFPDGTGIAMAYEKKFPDDNECKYRVLIIKAGNIISLNTSMWFDSEEEAIKAKKEHIERVNKNVKN